MALVHFITHPGIGENDRSATGFLPREEFWATADLFFAHPTESIRGWERAIDAQARIVAADQPPTAAGGFRFAFEVATRSVRQGWERIDG